MTRNGHLWLIPTLGLRLFAADYSGLTPRSTTELEQSIRKILAETKTPAAGVSILTRDAATWTAGIGKADVAANKDATPDTLFRIASISKGFVSLAVLKLQEEGKLDLQDTVRSRAPELEFSNRWESTDPVRIVHLLEHTTGWEDLSPREFAYADPKPLTLKEGLAYNPKSRKSRWRPGTLFSYCNSGPDVAAYIVEKISGVRFEDYVRQNFFLPLGMDSADYFLPARKNLLAQLYHADGKTPYPYAQMLMRPDGSISASAGEMGSYVRFLLNRGSLNDVELVKPASIDRMETPTSTLAAQAGLKVGYGLGSETSIKNGFVFHGHTGVVEGGLSEAAYLPEFGVGYVFMINSGNAEAFKNIQWVLTNFITRGLQKPALPLAPSVATTTMHPFVGYFAPISPRHEILRPIERLVVFNVWFENNGLISSLLGRRVRLVPVTDKLFRNEDDPVATVALIPDSPEGPLIQGAAQETFARLPMPEAWARLIIGPLAVLLMASSVVFAFIWIPRKLLGCLEGVAHLSVRVLPLLAVLSFGSFILVPILALDDVTKLGNFTIWSGAFFVFGLAFALLSVLSFIRALRARTWGLKRGVWVHSLAVAGANLVVLIYLACGGIIGYRPWA